jgi:hypothetical protein
MADREGADGFHAWLDDYARKAAVGEDISERCPSRSAPTCRESPDQGRGLEGAGRHPTGILTTLEADGTPISLPIRFVAVDDRVYLVTPAPTKQICRVKRNPRVSFPARAGQTAAAVCPWTATRGPLQETPLT